MKRLLLFLTLTFPALAEEKPQGYQVSGSFSTMLQERYIGLRISRNIHEGWMLWNELYLNLPAGFYVDFWDSYALQNRANHAGDELDLMAGWHKTLPAKLELDLSFALFNLYPLNQWWSGDVAVESFSVARSFRLGDHVIRPKIQLDWISETSDFRGGALVALPNVSHSWNNPLGVRFLAFNQQAFIAWDDGFKKPGDDSQGIFFRWSGGLDWKLANNLTLTLPGFTALLPIHRGNDGRRQETSWSTALTFRF